jgi:Caspase domain
LQIECIVTELRASGTTIRDEDLVHVWPLQRRRRCMSARSRRSRTIWSRGSALRPPSYRTCQARHERAHGWMLAEALPRGSLGCLSDKGKAMVFLDASHSGNVIPGTRAGDSADVDRIAADLASAETGVIVFSSSTGRQFSMESAAFDHGYFTQALLEASEGKSDRRRPGSGSGTCRSGSHPNAWHFRSEFVLKPVRRTTMPYALLA